MNIDQGNFGGAGFPPSGPGGPGGSGGSQQPNRDGSTFSQEFRHSPVSARVPERVARGVLSTGALVLDGPNEFVIDFMQGLTRPFQVAARIVLAPAVMEQFVGAVKDNIAKFEQRFGTIPALPKPPTDRRPTLQEIYDEFKLSDENLSGTYANAIMVGHSPAEFFFDFITNFYPTSAVSARVFLSASQMPRLNDAVSMAWGRFQQRVQAARQANQQHGQYGIAPPPNQVPPPQQPPAAGGMAPTTPPHQ